MPVPTLFVTGAVGVGKSTVASEISDLLREAEVDHAGVDLDALTWQWPSRSRFNEDLKFENLAAIWPNYLAHGATRLVLAGVIEDRAELARYALAVPGAEFVICRLVAAPQLREDRLRARMRPGTALDWHLGRTIELEAVFERSAIEDFIVDNSEREPREVASEILDRLSWLRAD